MHQNTLLCLKQGCFIHTFSPQTKTCYYCPHNPFYEVLQDSNKITHRMDPLEATEHVIPIGTLLLLDMRCTDFTKLVNPSQV